jgi:hypothetical protein
VNQHSKSVWRISSNVDSETSHGTVLAKMEKTNFDVFEYKNYAEKFISSINYYSFLEFILIKLQNFK